ncbi:MAG: 5'-nucleotidase C-terminal domain-containing protein [Actinomycetota bacterium]
MTNIVPARRSKRSSVLSLFAAFFMLAALVVASPGTAGANGETATIMEIQGTGHLSPYDGQTVTTGGVVTAADFNGFYMQDPAGDGDDNTSDGIFVFGFGSGVAVGDMVEVTGEVSEFIPGGAATGNLSVTQLSGTTTVLSSGNPLPAPVEVGRFGRRPGTDTVISDSELPTNLQEDAAVSNPDVDAIDFYETLEGMYVEVDRPVATSATRQFSNFSAEVFTVPSLGLTVSPANARSQRGGILLQPDPDNTGDQNPERVQINFNSNLYGTNDYPAINVGDRLADVRGVVGYSFGNYEVNATELVDVRSVRLRPQTSALAPRSGRVTVASYNVLNVAPDGSDDAQIAKLAEHITDNLRGPDVIALQEIQDNSGVTDDGVTDADETLQALADAVAAAGGPTYSFFDVDPADGAFGGVPGGNIRNAFFYNADRVDVLDFVSLSPGVLDSVGAPNPLAFEGSRSPLAAIFSYEGTPFTVVNVHNTSRFGSTPIFGGPQPFVQAGEQAREDQVAALNAFTDILLADDDSAIVMIAGDFNTFEWTDDLTEILPGDDGVLNNLMTASALNSQDRRNRYTFIFDGNSQALDHFFVTDNLMGSRSQLDIVHVNVDFNRLFSATTASDHEPLLGRFRLPSSTGPTELPQGPEPEGFTLQVLHASDLEGGVDALDRAGNFAAIVDALEDNEAVDGSVTISAGDNYIPGPFFGASGDRSMRDVFQSVYNDLTGRDDLTNIREGGGRGDITIMNIIGFDASAIGNHEFDAGSDSFESIIEEDVRGETPGDLRWIGANFPYLSANLDFSADGDLGNLFTSDILETTEFAASPDELLGGANPPKIAPSAIISVGGESIGVVGATTQLLASISSPGATTVIGPNSNDMAALAEILQPEVSALEDAGANKIILTSHLQQLALEEELATLLDGVDIIIAGGSDSLLANDDDELRDGDTADREYPVTATSAGGDPVVIVSTDGEYSYVGQLVVDFDANGVLVGDTDPSTNGPIKTEDEDAAALWDGGLDAAFADGTKAELVQTIVDAIRAVVIAKDGNVVGETSVFLEGRRSQVRTQETNFGNLSADANLDVAQAFDETVVLSLKNGGGIRAAIGEVSSDGSLLPPQANPATGKLEGQISQLDIENTLRFNNNLVLLNVTAAELLGLIEHAVAATAPGATPGQFGQIGGAQFVYDASADPGSRIVDLDLVDGGTVTNIVADGALVVAEDTVYRIVTLGFLAGGGDGYPFPDLGLASTDFIALDAALADDDPSDDGAFTFAAAGTEQDALAEYLGANHGIGAGTPFDQAETPPAADTRIVEASNVD